MSAELLQDRVGNVEQELARQGERIGVLSHDVTRIGAGVDKLLERETRRPQAITWTAIGATCGGLVSIAIVVWWLISSSPAVQDITRRLDKLDDPQIGRVPALEKRVDKLEGWAPQVRAGR